MLQFPHLIMKTRVQKMEFLETVPELLWGVVPHTWDPRLHQVSWIRWCWWVQGRQSVVATRGPNITHTWFLGLLPHLPTLIVCAHGGWLRQLLGG